MRNKGCSKGKSCGATCIDARERCVLELGPLVSPSVSKVANMLETRRGKETSTLGEIQSGIKGRVPRNDPTEPLRSGSTPLEKAKEKLKLFEQKLSDPNRTPSDKELEQFGKLKMAIEEFENKRDGQKKGLFGRQDKSDLDESKTREFGKKLRKAIPKIKDRQTIVKARQIGLRYSRQQDRLLRRESKTTTEEILGLKNRAKEVSETKVRLENMIKKLPQNNQLRSSLNVLLQTLVTADKSYSNAIKRLSSTPG
jgi:hypothetical protein